MERFRSIVVPTDFSPLSEASAARAAALARLDGAAIHLVHAFHVPAIVTPYSVAMPPGLRDAVRRAAGENLEAARKRIEARAGRNVTTRLAENASVVGAITEAITEHHADLVVMGTHGRSGLERQLLGSVAERTLRAVDVPVLVVKDEAETADRPISKILVAVDFSAHSDRALEIAADLAARLSASVDVLHVLHLHRDLSPYLSAAGVELESQLEAAAGERLDEARGRFERREVPVALELRRGSPSVTIAAAAREIGCQLIIMGTRGLGGIQHVLLGSTAERTLRAAPCSVLCVKADQSRDPSLSRRSARR